MTALDDPLQFIAVWAPDVQHCLVLGMSHGGVAVEERVGCAVRCLKVDIVNTYGLRAVARHSDRIGVV